MTWRLEKLREHDILATNNDPFRQNKYDLTQKTFDRLCYDRFALDIIVCEYLDFHRRNGSMQPCVDKFPPSKCRFPSRLLVLFWLLPMYHEIERTARCATRKNMHLTLTVEPGRLSICIESPKGSDSQAAPLGVKPTATPSLSFQSHCLERGESR